MKMTGEVLWDLKTKTKGPLGGSYDKDLLNNLTFTLANNSNHQKRLAKKITHLLIASTPQKVALWKLTRDWKALDYALRELCDRFGDAKLLVNKVDTTIIRSSRLEKKLSRLTKKLKLARNQLLGGSRLFAVGEIAAGILHDLKRPIGTIGGYIQLLKQESKSRSNGYINLVKIEKATKQAAGLLSQLERYLSPSLDVPSSVEIRGSIQRALRIVKHHGGFDKIRIKRNFSKRHFFVKSYPQDLEQIFLNLFLNAAEAMPEGGILTITLAPLKDINIKSLCVRITIEDSGKGVNASDIKKIFTPFFSTKRTGMGMGLTITKSLVTKIGGKIKVQSKVGRGTTFILVFPRCRKI